MESEERLQLARGAAELGVELSDGQIALFEHYARLLDEWNRRLNLTRIPADQVVPLHFLDSLTMNRAVDLPSVHRLIDVGSGAGFPGVPLKIAFPDIEAVLLDCSSKRLRFLDAVIEDLGLRGVRTVHARAEDAGRDSTLRETFDLATARALAAMDLLAEWLMPFVRIGGSAVALKSSAAAAEIAAADPAIRRMGGLLEPPVIVRIPGTDIQRVLAVISKVQRTPRRYPKPPAQRKQRNPVTRP